MTTDWTGWDQPMVNFDFQQELSDVQKELLDMQQALIVCQNELKESQAMVIHLTEENSKKSVPISKN
jgi:hypothetical protein